MPPVSCRSHRRSCVSDVSESRPGSGPLPGHSRSNARPRQSRSLQPFSVLMHLELHMPSLPTIDISAEILERARAGDCDAHECIYLLFSKPVYTLIRRLVIRPAVAEDLLQDVFVEIL